MDAGPLEYIVMVDKHIVVRVPVHQEITYKSDDFDTCCEFLGATRRKWTLLTHRYSPKEEYHSESKC